VRDAGGRGHALSGPRCWNAPQAPALAGQQRRQPVQVLLVGGLGDVPDRSCYDRVFKRLRPCQLRAATGAHPFHREPEARRRQVMDDDALAWLEFEEAAVVLVVRAVWPDHQGAGGAQGGVVAGHGASRVATSL
jgi:hypothetical protein